MGLRTVPCSNGGCCKSAPDQTQPGVLALIGLRYRRNRYGRMPPQFCPLRSRVKQAYRVKPVLLTLNLWITLSRGDESQDSRHTGPYGRGWAAPHRKAAPRKGEAAQHNRKEGKRPQCPSRHERTRHSSRPVNGDGPPASVR